MATRNRPWVDRYLAAFDPCPSGKLFANQFDTPELAWRACRNSEHMIWVLSKLNVDKWTRSLICCDIVEELLPIWERYYPDEKTPHEVLAVHRRWATENRGREPFWPPRLHWSEGICRHFSWLHVPEGRLSDTRFDGIVVRSIKWSVVFLLKKFDWDVVDCGSIIRRAARSVAYRDMIEQTENHRDIPCELLKFPDDFTRDAYARQCTVIRKHLPHPPLPTIPN